MFIIWGFRGYQKIKGMSFVHKECENCHHEDSLIIKELKTKFIIFWIPLFTTSTKYYLACPKCNRGIKISKQEAEECLVYETSD